MAGGANHSKLARVLESYNKVARVLSVQYGLDGEHFGSSRVSSPEGGTECPCVERGPRRKGNTDAHRAAASPLNESIYKLI